MSKNPIFVSIILETPLNLWKFYHLNTILLFIVFHCANICCSLQQTKSLRFSPVSMCLRPKRTCSGVICFGCFHIKRFIALFLFFRETLT
ncbi:hypothetical protein RND81_02G188000 [Saponaria officinalis]|uniref:Uncharacterized protein n=1 Tax=Saponaria officinalis TaxID=3572 RepID=A0AAW1MVJ8_SAPOF